MNIKRYIETIEELINGIENLKKTNRDSYEFSRWLAVANDLNLEFYTYQGALQQDSRDYCKRRAGGWFHISEIEKSASESWAGKIPGTNSSNILINRGGFNCNHQYIPVSRDAVPKNVLARAVDQGFVS